MKKQIQGTKPAAGKTVASGDRKVLFGECLDRSLAYLDQFAAGEFETFLDDLAGDYSGQIPAESLAVQWGQILQAFGERRQVLDSAVSQEEDGVAVAVTTLHILRKLVTTFVYDAEGAVIRTELRLATLDIAPQASEAWEEQAIRVGRSEKKLNGMMTLPRGVERPPVVLLLQGSGPANMNEQVGTGGSMPFADIAHGLAERGVASIRYDKRSYAYPEDMVYADVNAEYLDDAGAAVEQILSDGRVDGSRIFLLGHSEGGMVGPEITRRNPQIKGFISLAGTLRRLEDIILEQTKKMLDDADGMPEEQKQAQLEAIGEAVEQIKNLDPKEKSAMIMGASAAYWHSLNAIDTPALVRELSVPMLVLQGGEDFQVPAEVDYRLWQDTLSGKTNVTWRLYPELNHLFMIGGTKDHIDVSVYNEPGHVDTQVIQDLADWISGYERMGIE